MFWKDCSCLACDMQCRRRGPDFPTPYAPDFDGYLSKVYELKAKYGSYGLLRFNLAPHAPYTVCDANLLKAWKTAEELDVRLASLHSLGANPTAR